MAAVTQSAFAAQMGWNRSTVTRLKQQDRIVMTDGGLVDVEASLAKISATRGTRFDVERRWEDARSVVSATAPDPDAEPAGPILAPTPEEDQHSIIRRTRIAQMRKEEAEATRRELELGELSGKLLRRDAIEDAILKAVALIFTAADGMPDRLAPQLVGVDSMERVRALIKDAVESLLGTVSHELGAMARIQPEEL